MLEVAAVARAVDAGLDVLGLCEQLDDLEVVRDATQDSILAVEAGRHEQVAHGLDVELDLLVGQRRGERAVEVHQVAAPLVLAGLARLFAERIDQVDGEAAEVRRAVQHRVVPARVTNDARIVQLAGNVVRRRCQVRVKIAGENTYESTSGLNRMVEMKYGVVLRPSLTVPALSFCRPT